MLYNSTAVNIMHLYLVDSNVECLEMMIHEGCDVNAVDGTGRYINVELYSNTTSFIQDTPNKGHNAFNFCNG